MPISPISDILINENKYIDNEMEAAMKKCTLISRLKKAGLNKRSGDPISRIVYCLLIWPFLKKTSISAFCGSFIDAYLVGAKGVLYDFLKREDINWRKHSGNSSIEVYKRHDLGVGPETAFVTDDTLSARRGSKVEGVSSHFDHTSRRKIMGHQSVQLCHCSPKGTLPIDQHLYISDVKQHPLGKEFKDKRQTVSQDYTQANLKDKNELFRAMLVKATRLGFKAKHVLADSWYGNKKNISLVLQLGMTAVFMMKRGKLKYRFQGNLYTAKMLYQLVRRNLQSHNKSRFLTTVLKVEINLETNEKKMPIWQEVSLLFSKEKNSKEDLWVLILCTNLQYSAENILKTYAMRWGIEVYFKEIKQNMGFLSEQSTKYTVHYASIHLSAIRYTLLFNLMLDNGELNFANCRRRICDSLQSVTFATILWELFKSMINGVLDTFFEEIGNELVERIKATVNSTIEKLLSKALQIDEDSIQANIRAEQLGML